MKKFKITHNFFDNDIEHFDESNPPSWVAMDDSWWYTGYVLKIKVGESVKTDFRTIERVK